MLKKLFIITILIPVLFISCKNETDNLHKKEINKNTKETNSNSLKNEETKVNIDSIKMHAFENIYFGTFDEINSKKYTINDLEYTIRTYNSTPKKGLCYFMLINHSQITTQKKAKKEINNLKNIISKKYKNEVNLNRTYYIKHPEEMEKNENLFDIRSFYKYDNKIIGLPYEYEAFKWDLKYKEIKIGYFIENKNRTVMYQSSAKNDNYIIYIEITSKIIKPTQQNLKDTNIEDESKKF